MTKDIIINGVKVEVGQIWENDRTKFQVIYLRRGPHYFPIVTINLTSNDVEELPYNYEMKLYIPKKTLKTIVYWYYDKVLNSTCVVSYEKQHYDYKLIAKREIELTEGEGLE